MTARHERKYERSSTAILPERHRPVSLECPRDPSSSPRAEHETPKTLGWKTPAEALNEYLKSVQQSSVATTG